MNNNYLLCVDLETGSVAVDKCEVLSIASLAISPHTMEPVPGERGEFYSLMRPLDFNNLQEGALKVNKLTRKELREAPEQAQVFKLFADFCYMYNPKGKSPFSAPIACGKNIRNFDLPIIERLCRSHGMIDKEGKQNLFSKRLTIDLEDYLFHWFEGNGTELANYKMDTVRSYFGLSDENAHTAIQDVRDTAALIMKFQNLYRRLFKTVKFKNSMRA